MGLGLFVGSIRLGWVVGRGLHAPHTACAWARASKQETPRLTPVVPPFHSTTTTNPNNQKQFKDFDAVCSKGNLVTMYEWGFGPCDDYMSAVKANAGQTQFTFTVRSCLRCVVFCVYI